MMYRFDSDFPDLYFNDKTAMKIKKVLPVPVEKRKSVPVTWVAGNCEAHNGRQYYIKELMKYVKVDSYGRCLHNKDFANSAEKADIDPLLSQYKFYLAIENSNCKDYFTEKLWRCYEVGNVCAGIHLCSLEWCPSLMDHELLTQKWYPTTIPPST
jgi:hypothetical protein